MDHPEALGRVGQHWNAQIGDDARRRTGLPPRPGEPLLSGTSSGGHETNRSWETGKHLENPNQSTKTTTFLLLDPIYSPRHVQLLGQGGGQ